MKIYNTISRKKEDFVPVKKGAVGMYVCGPTVYDEPHIGHARSAYVFDVIRRYFEYRKFKVTFVRNVTDVDDKIIAKAKSASGSSGAGLKDTVKEISEKYLKSYHEAIEGLLGVKKPTEEPRAMKYIPKMIKFIESLIEKGCAYEAAGDVYFDIKKAKNYGKLSGQNLKNLESGARISPGDKKRDGLDFALWKASKEGEPAWPSPWGAGRPGWHIECSAMSSDILGDEFDIHAGGLDLIFPHHENEIAQSEGAGKKFARYWIHNGLLTTGGEKMAKSRGNFVTIKDFMEKYRDPDALKLFFLSSHYRSPADYTEENIDRAKKMRETISIFFRFANKTLEKISRQSPSPRVSRQNREGPSPVNKYKLKFEAAMDDDFNTPKAIAEIFNVIHDANSLKTENSADIYLKLNHSRQLVSELLSGVFGLSMEGGKESYSEKEKVLMKEYLEARKRKEYEKSDNFRRILANDHNIIAEDTKTGTEWRRKI